MDIIVQRAMESTNINQGSLSFFQLPSAIWDFQHQGVRILSEPSFNKEKVKSKSSSFFASFQNYAAYLLYVYRSLLQRTTGCKTIPIPSRSAEIGKDNIEFTTFLKSSVNPSIRCNLFETSNTLKQGNGNVEEVIYEHNIAYNLLLTPEYMILIVRSKREYSGVDVNGLAFFGSLLLRADINEEEFFGSSHISPLKILKGVGMPRNSGF